MLFGAAIIAALSLSAHASLRHGYLRISRQTNEIKISCSQNEYTVTEVKSAADAACQHVEAGTTAGSSDYPHTYRNFEGFDFNGIDGPFVEFPMKTGGIIYKGGQPGPDRIIINEQCDLAGQITHSGAEGNAFVGCEGTT